MFPLHQSAHWWFLHKGYTALVTTILGELLLFLAILPSYALGWEPGCGDLVILGPQTQRGPSSGSLGLWVEMIWKYKLSPDWLVLTKAFAKHWRGRDWLKKSWQLGRLLWMPCTPPSPYVYKATCCTALFTALQKTVYIFPQSEAASRYFIARKSHGSFFSPSNCLRLYI